jgi:MFS family permease
MGFRAAYSMKWNRSLVVVFLIVFVNFLGGTIVLPSLPLYAQRHFGASDSIIPLLNASYFAAQFLAAPFLGRLSDKYGRLPVLIFSQIGTVASFLMMGMAQNMTAMFAARLLDGITGGNIIVAQAYIADITPRQDRTRALGLIFAAFGIGYTFGPAVGGALSVFGEQVPFYVGAAISLVTVLLTVFTLKESLPPEERIARRGREMSMQPRDILNNPSLLLVIVIAFCAQFSMAMFQATFTLFGGEVVFKGDDPKYTALGVGILLGALGIGQIFTQVAIIPRIVPRFGERRTVILGTLLRSFGLLSLCVLVSPFLIGPISLLAFAVGSGIMMPSLQSLATTCVREEICGGVLGIYGSAVSLSIILGSAISGPLYTATPTLPYLVGGTLLALTVFPALLLLRQDRVQATAGAAA